MKTDYTVLDEALLSAIKLRPMALAGLLSVARVNKEASRLAEAHNSGVRQFRFHKPHWRFVDARLQALRKKRLIRHTSRGWMPATQ